MIRLKKLSMSNLAFVILNKNADDILRKYAEVELKKRLGHFSKYYNEFLHDENRKIKVRGNDINDYLFGSNPNMQQLMELYFMYVYSNNFDDNMLLFSEKHLCNQMDFASSFFTKVCDLERRNILTKIYDVNVSDDKKENLKLFYDMLETRKDIMKYEKKHIYDGVNRLKYNEALLYLDEYKKSDNYSIANCLKDLNVILKDSSKLSEQKGFLELQADYGYVVDYETENMKKSLVRIRKK